MPAPASSAFRSGAAGCVLLGGAAVALVVLVALQRLHPPASEAPPRPPHRRPGVAPTRPPVPLPGPSPVTPEPPAPEPLPPTEAPRPRPGHFDRREDGPAWTLTWGFADHHDEPLEVTCRIARDDHEREVAGFGYDAGAVAEARAARLREWAEAALRARGLEGVVRLEVSEEGWQARHALPPGLEAGEADRLDFEAKRFYQWMTPAFQSEWRRVTDDLVRDKGLRYEGSRLQIDYEGLAERASGPLADCTRALRWSGGRGSERRLLEVFLAFLQGIPYEVPPSGGGGADRLGLYVPTEVLVGNHGDCDSKSLTFAALWRRVGVPLVLVRVPGHMLLGVAVRPGPGERFVRLGNRYFVLCEVAGPARVRPGRTDAEGSFEYVLVEPSWS